LESSLNKVNNLYYQQAIQKSALLLEMEVQCEIITQAKEQARQLQFTLDSYKEKIDDVSFVLMKFF